MIFPIVADGLVIANRQCAEVCRGAGSRAGILGNPVKLHVGGVGKGRFGCCLPDSHAVGDLLAEDFLDEVILLFIEDHQHGDCLRQDGKQCQRGDSGSDAQAHAGRWSSD